MRTVPSSPPLTMELERSSSSSLQTSGLTRRADNPPERRDEQSCARVAQGVSEGIPLDVLPMRTQTSRESLPRGQGFAAEVRQQALPKLDRQPL